MCVDAKRELDNIMYVVGRQLGDFSPSMPASAAEGSADSKMYPAITKDMMAELRWRLEQVFEVMLSAERTVIVSWTSTRVWLNCSRLALSLLSLV